MRENKSTIRYDREELTVTLINYLGMNRAAAEFALNGYEDSRREGKDKACQSKVWHGPGHQSSTFCEARGGLHDETKDGKVLHMASLPSGGWAEWTDDDPYDRGGW